MSEDLSWAHTVPALLAYDTDHFEEDLLIQNDLDFETKQKHEGSSFGAPTDLPSPEQIKSGEEIIDFVKREPNPTDIKEQERVGGPTHFSKSDLDFFPQHYREEEDNSSSDESSVSDEMSLPDSEESVEVPVFGQMTEQESEKRSAMNEVVPGLQHTLIPSDECDGGGGNIAIQQPQPLQQHASSLFIENLGPPVVSANKWPPSSHPPEQDVQISLLKKAKTGDYADYAACVQRFPNQGMDVSTQPLPQEGGSARTALVIGLSQSSVDSNPLEPSLVSPDIIMEPNHFLEKGVAIVGKSLNPVVSSVHKDPGNEVKFCVRKRTDKKRTDRDCYTYTMKNFPASNPSDQWKCPEAFDGRNLLRHVRKHAPEYATFLDIRGSSHDLKMAIYLILGRIPRRPNHSLTTAALVHTLFHMEGLLEMFVRGLGSIGRYNLADEVNEGLKELRDIRNKACNARQLSLELTK